MPLNLILNLPEFCLVVLIGPSGAGKSSFARTHFQPTEVISSDYCRALVCDDENSLDATSDAFELVRTIAAKRLARRRLTVIDATNVKREDRQAYLSLAKQYHTLCAAIVLNLPEKVCQERNQERPERSFGRHVVRSQAQQLRRSLKGLRREGFRYIYTLNSPEEVDAVEINRQRLWTDRRHEHGPFDVIGDVHGCFDELTHLLDTLGYRLTTQPDGNGQIQYQVCHPDNRKLVFLGDLVDRGPRIPDVLRLVMDMVADDTALCIPGNHETKLLRKLRGRDVKLSHGLAQSVAQLEAEPPAFQERVVTFLDSLISHYVLDDGKLVVAHAGLPQDMQGRASGAVRQFALYGETSGETDEFGLPIRYNWAADYRGSAMVVYGHTPVQEAEWFNRTICIDTGCVFGGQLTALRYPEQELVAIPAQQEYFAPLRPLAPARPESVSSEQQDSDDVLDMADVQGKRFISTSLHHTVSISAEHAAAALEVMSRFAIDPRWLMYLPPTMAPADTTAEPGLLEHPAEAFAYFAQHGQRQLVCEQKHMGSRAVVIVCRDETTAQRRFGIPQASLGVVYTRTGRRFFHEEELEAQLLERLRRACETSDVWRQFETDWICLDCELMPWSAKAQALLLEQYAPTGAAAQTGLTETISVLEHAQQRGLDVAALSERYTARLHMAEAYREAYRRYCWPVSRLDDLKLAPFHLLATEGAVHTNRDHVWHMETLASLCRTDEGLLLATPYTLVTLDEEASRQAATDWWLQLTAGGGEGMVVKPLPFFARGRRGLIQPALKCRGQEYLRLIYGPEYTAPEHLERLRERGVSRKRSLALREFALGIEGLERFVRHEPLRRVHECVFGVLALESEPVDPRL